MIHRNQPLFGNDSITKTTTEPTKDIIDLFAKVNNRERHKRRDNYVIDDTVKKQSIAYSVTYLNGRPALASIAWTRPIYTNSIRIMTKYCVDPDLEDTNFGKGTENLLRLDVIDQMEQQIVIARTHGYETFFITQEDKTHGRRVGAMTNTINNHSSLKWQVSNQPVLVAPDPVNPACWQYVISNNDVVFDYSMYPHMKERDTDENN